MPLASCIQCYLHTVSGTEVVRICIYECRMLAAAAAIRWCAQLCTLVVWCVLAKMQAAAAQDRSLEFVETGEALQKAVFHGVKHIVVTRHLDMGQDPLWDRLYGSIVPSVPKKSMLSVANGTQTITVRS